jgi:mRNA interferase MazF
MPDFEPGAIVRVPFPYSDGTTRQHRPALVVASTADGFLIWVLMVTSEENRGWPGDVPIADHAACGLPAPSIIRTAKIATIEAKAAEVRGRTSPEALSEVRRTLGGMLGL